ncbi:carboxylesterase family protein [Hymenobacter sp. BT683]|uniref:Carboxylesterase family protein n=1 Tax=Hymenobacter jeongseonensis TaxID=2791027 RepID=A0ABS0IJK6_9BACT|nr:alpha/beta hydrolase fold domain-containing protein [Hymenobacter jeongseonensis]MBF9238563.1 carboxylesterase family protein [Hymenobacter jeongseonensis]
MKATLLFVWLLLGAGYPVFAQNPIDITGGRYFDPIFPTVTVTPGVVYGSAVNFAGTTQPLIMDIYQPAGDVAPERPVIIFAHQGGFVSGSRSEQYMVDVCTRFAKLGYVTASIDYRLFFFPFDVDNLDRAAFRGMQDMRAAVRFFRKDAATDNTYRVSPSRIVVGGASAGAFMALAVGYLDKVSEVPASVNVAAMGGIEGMSGNPDYSSEVLAVLNLSGATERPELIEAGDAPLYSIHGTDDAVVPYLEGTVGASLPPKYVYGSGRLNPYATSIGVPNVLRTLDDAPHIPMYGTSAAALAYAETTFRDIRDFLRPLLVPVTPTTYPSLVISTPTDVLAGTYQDITITGSQATLTGAITVLGTLTVQNNGALKTDCSVVEGPGNFVLEAGGTLRICSSAGIAASGATGAIQNTGTRTFSTDAIYTYEGTANQVTGSGLPAQVRELEIAVPAASAVSLTNAVRISQRLLPTSGTLSNATRALTLLSSADGTALVAPGAGTVSNAFTVQRYIDPSVNPGLGYRHLATPLAATTASLATGTFSPVLNTAYNTSAQPELVRPFPTVFEYDQRRTLTSPATSYSFFDKGWAVPTGGTATTTPLERGRGYAVNTTADQTLAFTGPLTRNNEAISVTLTAAATPQAGWHLVGNPFASALNWDNVPIPAGMSSAMYIFVSTSQYDGQYRAYVNGVGPAAAATIPLGQGFFVRSLVPAPITLTFPVSARITDFDAANTATVQRGTADARPRLRLTVADATKAAATDETYLYVEAGATTGTDLRFDAAKMPNPSGLNLATVAAGQQLAINGLPALAAATVVPLALTVPRVGTYVLAAEQLVNFAPGSTIFLNDAVTGTRTPLAAGTQYRFSQTSLTAAGRFTLELTSSPLAAAGSALAAQLQVYPNPASGSFTVLLPRPVGSQGQASARLTNALGQTVRAQQLAAAAGQPLQAEVDVRGLAPGVYQLHLTVGSIPLVRRVVVQ